MTQWCKPLSAASTQQNRPVLSRSNSTVTWTHPKIDMVKRESGLLTHNTEHSEVNVNEQSYYFLLTQYAIYIDCLPVSTSTSWYKQSSPSASADSHTLYSKTERVLLTKWLTVLTFSPRNTSEQCWIPLWLTCLKHIIFRCDMSLCGRSIKLEWIRLSLQ